MGKLKILPPVYLLATLLLMVGLHVLLPVRKFVPAPFSWVGMFLLIIGLGCILGEAWIFKKVGTPIKPFKESTHLITGGLYRFSRNPIYLSMVVLLLGVAIRLGTLSPFLPIPLFTLLIQEHFIKKEEAMLEQRFGETYAAYRNKVRRWF